MKHSSPTQKAPHPSKVNASVAIIAFIITVTLVVYWQVGSHGFIVFDDDVYILKNQHVNSGLTFENIKWAFGFSDITYWHPVTWLSHMLDSELFGLKAGMHHLMSVLLHVFNGVLLFILLNRLTGSIWKSGFAAALFALHPVNVDSVAWASERKTLLSMSFFLLTVFSYLEYIKKPGILKYALMAFLFTLSLLSKTTAAVLPCILLLLDYWPLRRFSIPRPGGDREKDTRALLGLRHEGVSFTHLIMEKVPLLLLAIAAIIISSQSIKYSGAFISTAQMPMSLRIENAIVSYALYLYKAFWPAHLTIFYPYPESIPLWQVAGAGLMISALTMAAVMLYSRAPYVIVGWLWFLGALVPVSGIVQGGLWPRMAERWAYLPFIGLFIIVSWGLHDLSHAARNWSYRKEALATIRLTILVALLAVTWKQIGYWKDDVKLFTHAITVVDNNFVAYNDLGAALFAQGDVDGCIRQFSESIKAKPDFVYARNNLGKALFAKKNYDAALKEFATCMEQKPSLLEPYKFTGYIQLERGDVDEAIKTYTIALKIDPRQPEVNNYLGLAYIRKGFVIKAASCFQEAVNESPGYAEAMRNLEDAKTLRRELDNRMAVAQEYIQKDPKNAALYMSLGDMHSQQGEYEKAIGQYREALLIQPASTQAMFRIVLAYSDLHEYSSAIEMLQNMRQLQPGNPEICYNIACLYAKQGKEGKSIDWLKQAVEKGFNNWDLIKRDPDLASLRYNSYFIELLKGH